MITIQLNGEEKQIKPDTSVADLLEHLEINNRYCAVEKNLELIPRELHSECNLVDGDRIEIVTLVGGG